MKNTLFLVFIGNASFCFGQSKDVSMPTAPSPKLAELSKYAEFTTVAQHGVVPIDISLFEVSTGNFSHPISLSYHSGGIKVNQDATWVGLGWSLIAGGSITRAVRDIPDDATLEYKIEFEEVSYAATNITEVGWLQDPGRISQFPNITNDDFKQATDRSWNESPDVNAAIALRTLQGERPNILYSDYEHGINDYSRTKYDLQPDIFYLNIGEKNVKFIFGADGTPKILNSPDYYKITPIQGGTDGITLLEFIITDNQGNKYYFGQNGKIESTTVETYFYSTSQWIFGQTYNNIDYLQEVKRSQAPISKTFNTGWFLTKIETISGRNIYFGYLSPSSSSPLLTSYEIGQFRTRQITSDQPSISTNGNQWNKTKAINHSIKTHYLNKITFPLGTVDIELSSRTDLSGAYKIDKITLKNQDQKLINNIIFTNYYLNGRLFLDKITNNDKNYDFNYNTKGIPPKNSVKQDFWGYVCEKSTDLIPKIFVYPTHLSDYYRVHRLPAGSFIGNEHILPGSDRTVDINSIQAGVLDEIVYPTGGKSKYCYEPNEYFDNISNTNIQGGGLRIYKIVKTDENDKVLLTREYNYVTETGVSSGVLINKPAFATPTSYEWINDKQIRYYAYSTSLSEFEMWNSFTLRTSNNYFPLTNLEGNQVGYTRVEEIMPNNGKKTNYYYPPKNFNDNATDVSTSEMVGFNAFMNVDTSPALFVDKSQLPEQLFISYLCGGSKVPVYNEMYIFSENHGYYHADGHADSNMGVSTLFYNTNTVSGKCELKSAGQRYQDANSTFTYSKDFLSSDFISNYINSIVWGQVIKNGSSVSPFPYLSDDNDLKYEKVYREVYENEAGIPLKEINYTYQIHYWDGIKEEVKGIVAAEHNVYSTLLMKQFVDATMHYFPKRNFLSMTYGLYSMPKAWGQYSHLVNAYAFPHMVTTTEKLEGQPVTTEKEYTYNDKFFINKETTTLTSENIKLINHYSYPFHYSNTSGFINDLKTANNLSSIIEEIKYSSDLQGNDIHIISGRLNKYKTGGKGLIDVVYKLETDKPIPLIDFKFSNQLRGVIPELNSENLFSYDSKFYKNIYIKFNSYDGFANPTSVTNYDGIVTTFLWDVSYNSEYLTSVITNPGTNLERIMKYAYIPLIGLISKTDENNVTTTYQYDDANRLKLIIDNDGDIQARYKYNYKIKSF